MDKKRLEKTIKRQKAIIARQKEVLKDYEKLLWMLEHKPDKVQEHKYHEFFANTSDKHFTNILLDSEIHDVRDSVRPFVKESEGEHE